MTQEEIEQAAIDSALNMGPAKDIFIPNVGWVMLNREFTEIGIVYFTKLKKEGLI